MKRVLMLIGLLAMLACVPFAFAQKGTETEEEDPNTLYFIGLDDGSPYQGEFATENGAQLFAFNGSAGDSVTITMVQTDTDTFFDPYIVLVGERGQVYAYNDDSESPDDVMFSSAIVDFELPADGTYYVLATTFGAVRGLSDPTEGPFPYELTASGFTAPANREEDRYAYAGVDAEVGTTGSLAITQEEPVFFVTFIGSAGDTINILTDTSGGDSVDTLLYVFDNSGARIDANDDSDGLDAEIRALELPDNGIYFIWATSYDFPSGADGTFTGGEFDFAIEASN